MDPSLNALRAQLDLYFQELGTLRYRQGAGLRTEASPRSLRARYPTLSRAESFHAVRDALGGKVSDDDEPRRLRRLLELLASEVEDRLAQDATDAVAQLEARATLAVGSSGEESFTFHEALAQLPREPTRKKRESLESGLGRFLWESSSPYARRVEAATRTAEVLELSSYVALRELVSGFPFAPLVEEGERALVRTEDAYRDVLGYLLRKLDANLRAQPGGDARQHDLVHAARAPQLAVHFRWEELLPAVNHWLSDLGFPPDAERRIRLDTEVRDGKSPRAFAVPVRAPDEVRLAVPHEGGLGSFAAVLHAYGRAQHFAWLNAKAPVEDRRLVEPSVSEGYAALFAHLLLDEGWLRRYLRLPQPVAREAARASAFHQTLLLRRDAAKLPYELSLYARGPGEEAADEYEERQRKALFVGVHRGFYLHEVKPRLEVAHSLRGWALEARLHRVLRERFNEDWWRNPSAGSYLHVLFARSGRDDAAELADELTGEPPSLDEVSRRLIQVLGA